MFILSMKRACTWKTWGRKKACMWKTWGRNSVSERKHFEDGCTFRMWGARWGPVGHALRMCQIIVATMWRKTDIYIFKS